MQWMAFPGPLMLPSSSIEALEWQHLQYEGWGGYSLTASKRASAFLISLPCLYYLD